MNVTIGLEEAEEILSWNVSDEALEIAGTAGQVIAGGFPSILHFHGLRFGVFERGQEFLTSYC